MSLEVRSFNHDIVEVSITTLDLATKPKVSFMKVRIPIQPISSLFVTSKIKHYLYYLHAVSRRLNRAPAAGNKEGKLSLQ